MAESVSENRITTGGGQRAIATYWMTLRMFGRWDDILALQSPPQNTPYLLGMWHFMRGSALLRKGDVENAEQALVRLRGIQSDPKLKTLRVVVNSAGDLLSIAQHTLAGDIAQRKGDIRSAISEYKQAILIQDQLRYMEPPDWLQSTRLSLGQLYLSLKRFSDAELIFNEDLNLLQENGWALYGLLASMRGQNKAGPAADAERRFKRAWQYADININTAYF